MGKAGVASCQRARIGWTLHLVIGGVIFEIEEEGTYQKLIIEGSKLRKSKYRSTEMSRGFHSDYYYTGYISYLVFLL